MKDGQPSQWALRARVGAGLYLAVGMCLIGYGILRMIGWVER
jgi:hypothetical protein